MTGTSPALPESCIQQLADRDLVAIVLECTFSSGLRDNSQRVSQDERSHPMKIENRQGQALTEATVSVDDTELIDLLEGLADVVERKRAHLHFKQLGGPQLVVRRTSESDSDPLGRQMDWWLGPAVLLAALFIIVVAITVIGWAAGLVG